MQAFDLCAYIFRLITTIMQLIFAFLALLSVASAFNMGVSRVTSKNSLQMGDMFDTLQYKKIFNRFTFKKLAAAAATAGLEATLKAEGPITSEYSHQHALRHCILLHCKILAMFAHA
jgi:hypothetical protein